MNFGQNVSDILQTLSLSCWINETLLILLKRSVKFHKRHSVMRHAALLISQEGHRKTDSIFHEEEIELWINRATIGR